MRLRKLQLSRYGKFTDFDIDFDKVAASGIDFHMVYGANEAGKSTALAAWLDLLFGIPPQSKFNFLHDYSSMKISAVLDASAKEFAISRIKKPKNSLLDACGDTLNENVLGAELGGISREAYSNMFSLDDDSLEKGGESILASEGELGELLYSATTGVADLSVTLSKLSVQAAKFHKKGGRNTHLNELKQELVSLQEARAKVDIQAREFSKLVTERDERARVYDQANSEVAGLKIDIDKLRQLLSAKPLFDDYVQLDTQIQAFADLPEAPQDWRLELGDLQKNETVYTVSRDRYRLDIEKQEASLGALIEDESLQGSRLAADARLQELEPLRSGFLAAQLEIPVLKSELELLNHDVQGLLRRLGKSQEPEPENLLLAATATGQLRNLIKASGAHVGVLASSQRGLTEAEQRVESASNALNSEQGSSADSSLVNVLQQVVTPIEGLHLESRISAKEADVAQLQASLQQALLKLLPWSVQGTNGGQELSQLVVPRAADLLAWKDQLKHLSDDAVKLNLKKEADLDQVQELQAKAHSLRRKLGVTSEPSVDIRKLRDDAWQAHRQELNENSANEFEQLMRRDDVEQTSRLQQGTALASLDQLQDDVQELKSRISVTEGRLQKVTIEQQAVRNQFSAAIVSCSQQLDQSQSVEGFVDWLSDRGVALELSVKYDEAVRELEMLQRQTDEAVLKLRAALEAAGLDSAGLDSTGLDLPAGALPALLSSARQAVQREHELQGLRQSLDEAKLQVENRQRELSHANTKHQEWLQQWQAVCGDCWFATATVEETPGIESVEEILTLLGTLDTNLQQREKLQSKLTAAIDRCDEFETHLLSLVDVVSLNSDNTSPDQLYSLVANAVSSARVTQQQHDSILGSLQESRVALQGIEEKIEVNRRRMNTFFDHFKVQDIESVRLKLDEVKNRSELLERRSSRQIELLSGLQVSSIAEVTKALSAFDREASRLQLAKLEESESLQSSSLQQLHTDLAEADRKLNAVGGDDAVAVLEEQRQTLLLDITEKTRLHLQDRLGVMAAERALKTYRDKHRSSMMQRASEAFDVITSGRYTRLDSQSANDSEKLIGVLKTGETKRSDQMSKGTRFQLYLALRVAGYHEYVKTRASVPFIADDIMETFDDQRAKAAFSELVNMAKTGQVIYLTHHEHLCQIAQTVCPDVKVHRLPN